MKEDPGAQGQDARSAEGPTEVRAHTDVCPNSRFRCDKFPRSVSSRSGGRGRHRRDAMTKYQWNVIENGHVDLM